MSVGWLIMLDFEKIDNKLFEKHAVMQKEVLQRMFARLKYFKMQPELILDLKTTLGLSTLGLQKHYPKALVLGMDSSWDALRYAKTKKPWFKSFPLLQAHHTQMPFASESVDFIFANQLICTLDELRPLIHECYRVLKPQGCLLFSSLGPDTFKECQTTFNLPLNDLHDIGDLLLQEGFSDPVMDREDLVLKYSSPTSLETTLKAQGLASHQAIHAEQVTYEVIYGQAWRGNKNRGTAKEQIISIDKLRQSLKKSD
jgi:malonyl-CoA O-methyltransferase